MPTTRDEPKPLPRGNYVVAVTKVESYVTKTKRYCWKVDMVVIGNRRRLVKYVSSSPNACWVYEQLDIEWEMIPELVGAAVIVEVRPAAYNGKTFDNVGRFQGWYKGPLLGGSHAEG